MVSYLFCNGHADSRIVISSIKFGLYPTPYPHCIAVLLLKGCRGHMITQSSYVLDAHPPFPVLGSRTTPFTDRYILAAVPAAVAGWSFSAEGGRGCKAATLEELWLLGNRQLVGTGGLDHLRAPHSCGLVNSWLVKEESCVSNLMY